MKRLRLAVIGVGHLGRIHARILAERDDVELVAVADPVPAARTSVAEGLSCAAVDDFRGLLGRIDAAVVAVPTSAHYQVAQALLAGGVHVFVEKPLAPSLFQAREIAGLARRQARVLQVGHVERFNPAWTAALPHLREPKFIEATRQGGFKFRSLDIGIVLDLMIHDLDLVCSVVRSPVQRVEALGLSLFGRVEDVAQARLVFENGCVATLTASRASRTAARTMRVGTPLGLVQMDFAARTVEVIRPSQAVLRGEVTADSLSPAERAACQETWLDTHLPIEQLRVVACDQITAELADFTESIRQARQPKVSGDDACSVLELAERIQESLRRHAWDGTTGGRMGPQAAPPHSVVPAPHFRAANRRPLPQPPRREAG